MLTIGNYIENVKCESFLDPSTGRIRIRPLPQQGLSTDLVVESLKTFRDINRYPLGSIFIAKRVKICQKEIGRIYLRADNQMLEPI